MLIILIVMLFAMTGSQTFYDDFYEGDQVLRVTPNSKQKVKEVLKIKTVPGLEMLEVWMPTFRPGHPADFYARKSELSIMKEYLRNKSISYSVLVGNVTETLGNQRTWKRRQRYKNGGYDYEKFHPLNEIYDELNKLAVQYSNVASVFSLGKSYERRDMKAIKIIGKAKKNKRIIFIECGTHPREWISPATCMWIIETILRDRPTQNGCLRCDRIDWVIVPVINVDGYEYTWSKTGRFWRKNRKPNNNSNCIGTDLNRNWGYKWGGIGSSNNPCASSYRGTSPFSEIETRNVAKYLYKNRCQLLAYISLHSYSQLWMTPWGYKREKPEHYTEMKRVADIAVNAIRQKGGDFEDPGPSSEIIYDNTGSPKDWTYAVLNIKYSYGVELRPHYNGSYGFLIPPDQIKPSGEEITAAMKAISTTVHLNEYRR